MNATTYPVTSPREFLAAVDAAEADGALRQADAALLRQRLEGLSLAQIGQSRGITRQAVQHAQQRALRRLGLEPGIVERLLDAVKAEAAERLRRRARWTIAEPMTRPQGLDALVGRDGLDAAATHVLERAPGLGRRELHRLWRTTLAAL